MRIELSRFKLAEKETLVNDLITYFLEIDTNKIKNVTTLDYPYLDSYWEDENRIPFKILKEEKVIGFVLINDFVVNKQFSAAKSIAEFYIKPPFRRKGVGRNVAHQIFEKYPGKWEIRQAKSNIKAQQFWRKVIVEYTQNDFEELLFEGEFVQLFKI